MMLHQHAGMGRLDFEPNVPDIKQTIKGYTDKFRFMSLKQSR